MSADASGSEEDRDGVWTETAISPSGSESATKSSAQPEGTQLRPASHRDLVGDTVPITRQEDQGHEDFAAEGAGDSEGASDFSGGCAEQTSAPWVFLTIPGTEALGEEFSDMAVEDVNQLVARVQSNTALSIEGELFVVAVGGGRRIIRKLGSFDLAGFDSFELPLKFEEVGLDSAGYEAPGELALRANIRVGVSGPWVEGAVEESVATAALRFWPEGQAGEEAAAVAIFSEATAWSLLQTDAKTFYPGLDPTLHESMKGAPAVVVVQYAEVVVNDDPDLKLEEAI